jgi:hypothetical protein
MQNESGLTRNIRNLPKVIIQRLNGRHFWINWWLLEQRKRTKTKRQLYDN